MESYSSLKKELGPIREGYALSQAYYTSQSLYEAELSRIFYRQWLCVGHTNRIPSAGDYFLVRVDRESVIILRDRDGQVNGFYNVCRHRGSQLLDQPSGNVGARIVCPYHAWGYRLDGRLQGAASMAAGFDPKAHGLHAIHVQVHAGLIFVCFSPEPDFDLASDIAPVVPFLEFQGMPTAKPIATKVFLEHCNWKTASENNVECYHCSPSHQTFVRNFTAAFIKSYGYTSDMLDGDAATEEQAQWTARAEEMGHLTGHYQTAPGSDISYSMGRSPFRKGAVSSSIGGKAVSIPMGQFTDFDGGWTGGDFNTQFIILANVDHIVTYRSLPVSVNETEVEFTWFVNPDAMEGVHYRVEDVISMWDHTFKEDVQITERNQRGILSRAYVPGPLSLQEAPVVEFHRWYARQMGLELEPPSPSRTAR
jgi:Rieske 2Fe-2S family protein